MTPDKKSFFAATHISKQNKYGRIGMLELIPQVMQLWLNKRNDILQSSENITQYFLQQNASTTSKDLDKSILDLTFDHLSQLSDIVNGGFGTSPKFPIMHHLYFLLRYYKI